MASSLEDKKQDALNQIKEIKADINSVKDKISDLKSSKSSLQNYITETFYTCTDEILFSLGQMYAGGGEFTENIDQVGGTGTAEFVADAIRIYCKK